MSQVYSASQSLLIFLTAVTELPSAISCTTQNDQCIHETCQDFGNVRLATLPQHHRGNEPNWFQRVPKIVMLFYPTRTLDHHSLLVCF
jgi:hypothetical protein